MFYLPMMAVLPAMAYGLHALFVLVTKRGTYRLFFWPDYTAIPVAFAAWIVLEMLFSGKSLVNLVLEPMYASMGWSALVFIRSLVNVITQRKPTRVESFVSAALLVAAMVFLFAYMPCMPE